MKKIRNEKPNVLKDVTATICKNKIYVLFLVFLKTFSVGLGIVVPYLVGEVIDKIDEIQVIDILLLASFSVSSIVLESIVTYHFSLLGQKAAVHTRNSLWRKILYMKPEFFNTIHSGELSSRMIHDTSSVSEFVVGTMPDFYASSLTLILMVVILMRLDIWLGIIFCIIAPVIILVMVPAANRIRDIAEAQQGILAELNMILSETIEHIKFVKAYGAEESEEIRVQSKMQQWLQNSKQHYLIQAILSPVLGGITSLSLFIICAVGAYRIKMGYISAGTITIFALYLINAIEPVELIGNFMMEYQELKGSLSKVNEILTKEKEYAGGVKGMSECKKLTFSDVRFRYDKQIVLDGISFTVNQNEYIAIVGESGAGKTTIFSLIERFYPLLEGDILWGEEGIEDIQMADWRKRIGYVFQDNMIISGTIKDNLLYGMQKKVTHEQLMEAISRADLYEFVESLEEKMETYVGEKGELLSGGQKQRLAIARVFLRNPQILLLDEVTANLDAESEQQVDKALKELYRGRIVLVIAHRLHTVINADRILVLKDGKIVGEGQHEDLISMNEYYRNIVHYEFVR